MTDDAGSRLDRLEALAAEQERTIEELSEQLAEQWRIVDRLQRKFEALAGRHEALEDRLAPEAPSTRPPHW
jgi:SlyX protein